MVNDSCEKDTKHKKEKWENEKLRTKEIDIIDPLDCKWNLFVDFDKIIR